MTVTVGDVPQGKAVAERARESGFQPFRADYLPTEQSLKALDALPPLEIRGEQ
jgi:hypothetical protein